MQTQEPQQTTTFHAPWMGPACFSTLFLLVGLLLMVGFRFLGAPWPVQCCVIVMIVIGLGLSLETALYRLCLTEDAINEFRWGWRSYSWQEVVGWTKWSESLLFIKLRNGRTIGTDRLGFGKSEIDKLSEILSQKAGPMARGERSVLPWYLDWTIGGMLRAGPLTKPS